MVQVLVLDMVMTQILVVMMEFISMAMAVDLVVEWALEFGTAMAVDRHQRLALVAVLV